MSSRTVGGIWVELEQMFQKHLKLKRNFSVTGGSNPPVTSISF